MGALQGNDEPSRDHVLKKGCYCGRPAFRESECIGHCADDDKDINSFNVELANVCRRGQTGRSCEFAGFVFPKSGWKFPKSFTGGADFAHAVFLGDVSLSNVHFGGRADFRSARFYGAANFHGCKFDWAVEFEGARFEGVANLEGIKFGADATFLKVVFCKETYFAGSTFAGKTVFDHANFGGKTRFDYSRFDGHASFEEAEHFSGTFFFRAIFKNPEEVVFANTDLGKVSFLECDVSQVQFFKVKWNRDKKWYEASRDRVYDALSSTNHAGVAEIYRRLQANYLAAFRHAEAADFYVGEQEMIRRSRGRIGRYFSINALYSYLSLYGESVRRPLGWLAVVLLVAPAVFLLIGVDVDSAVRPHADALQYCLSWKPQDFVLFNRDYWRVFRLNLGWISFYRSGPGAPAMGSWLQSIVVAETILAISLVAFALLALRRRFRRKSF